MRDCGNIQTFIKPPPGAVGNTIAEDKQGGSTMLNPR